MWQTSQRLCRLPWDGAGGSLSPLEAWPAPLIKNRARGGLPKSLPFCMESVSPAGSRAWRSEVREAGGWRLLVCRFQQELPSSFPSHMGSCTLVQLHGPPRGSLRQPPALLSLGCPVDSHGVEHRPSSLTPFASRRSLQPCRPDPLSPCPGHPLPIPPPAP